MKTSEVKKLLIDKINNLEDEHLIDLLFNIVSDASSNQKPYQFTEHELSLLKEAEIQLENGQSKPHEQFIKEVDEWLRKK